MRALCILVAVLLAGTSARAADLYAAGSSVFRVDSASGRVLATSRPLDTQASDLEVDPRGRYVAVTTSSGLFLFQPDALTPNDSLIVGILDAVEIAPDGDTLYVLLHPGSDRKSVRSGHRILGVTIGPTLSVREIVKLGPRSYDIFLTRDGRQLFVTNMLGREIDIVDLPAGRVTTRRVQIPDDKPNQMAVLRSVAFPLDGRSAIIGESARGLPLILWRYDLASGEFEIHRMPCLLSAITLVVAGESGIVVNGTHAVLRVQLSEMTPGEPRPLNRDAWHAVSDAGGTVYFAAPSEDGARLLRDTGREIGEFAALPQRVTRLALRAAGAAE